MSKQSPFTQQLLHTLLDRFEQPNRQRVARVHFKAKEHPAYYSPNDVQVRQKTNTELAALARRNIVRLHWHKLEEGNWLEAVDLVSEKATELYALLQRAPRHTREQVLLDLLNDQSHHADWQTAFVEKAVVQLDAHRSVAPLNLDDADWNRDLLRALDAIAQLKAPTLERTLSVSLFADSKRFESLRASVLRVLRRHASDAVAYGDDDDALLRAFLIERAPEYVPIAGPLVLRLDQTYLDLAVFDPSVALPATLLRRAIVVDCLVTRVITIENATTFTELTNKRSVSTLLIFTGGFASPIVLSLLRAIHHVQPGLTFYHWGDIDVGGLRILAHLRGCLSNIKPLAMDRAIFERYRAYTQSLTRNDRSALQKLRTDSRLADRVELIDHLLATNLKLEQEAIPMADVSELLGT